MSNLALGIGGRAFTVSCADGEESHVEMLGRMIDERARKVGTGQNETRTLLFAALMLADELHEAHRALPVESNPSPEPVAPAIDEASVAKITSLAVRLENLAMALEQGPVSP